MNMGKKQGHSRKHAKSFVEILSIKLRETFERYLDSSATLSTYVRPCSKKAHSIHLTRMTSNTTHLAKHLETWQHGSGKSLDEASTEQITCILT
jgi:hypothetical protein